MSLTGSLAFGRSRVSAAENALVLWANLASFAQSHRNHPELRDIATVHQDSGNPRKAAQSFCFGRFLKTLAKQALSHLSYGPL